LTSLAGDLSAGKLAQDAISKGGRAGSAAGKAKAYNRIFEIAAWNFKAGARLLGGAGQGRVDRPVAQRTRAAALHDRCRKKRCGGQEAQQAARSRGP